MKTRTFVVTAVTLAFLFLIGVASAQITSQTGAITGTVTDPSGAVVPKAQLTLTSARGVNLSKESSSEGAFTFTLLQPGVYQLSVKAAGFQGTVIDKVEVQITTVTTLPVRLRLGAEATELTVTADAPLVNTSNPTMGQVLNAAEISKLPLPTRNFTGLLALNAGTSADLPTAATAGRASSLISVNGQRNTANNLVINGVDANNLGNNNFGAVAIPSPDTLEEFRVQTSLYDASQGKTSGGNINVITKSGSDKYHGEVYDFFRNEALNANSWFFNHAGTRRPPLKQQQFGGNFGGRIPGLSKTFFFGSYQGTRQINGVSSSVTASFPVIPASRTSAAIQAAFGLPAPPDPVAVKFLNLPGQYGGFLIPSGTGVTPPAGQNGNVFGQIAASGALHFKDDQFNANIDHSINDKHRLSLKYFRAQALTNDPLGGEGGGNLGSGQTSPLVNHLGSLTYTFIISPSVSNEARIGYNRIQSATVGHDPASVADVGLTRFNSSIYSGVPLLFTNDINPAFGGISTNNDQASATSTYHFTDTIAWTRGRHTFRGGFEFRRYQINTFNNFASRGFLAFNKFTDFLTGNILQAFVGTGQTDRGFRARDVAGYFQDDWKATSRLTLNLGLRYDYLGPSTDNKDRVGNFDPSRLDANTLANGGPGLLNGFILPASADFGAIQGTPGVDRSTYNHVDHKNFAPRVGLAYDVYGNGKTSVRAGYGIYYVRVSNQTLLQLITAVPFFQLSSLVNPGTTLANPFPALPLPAQFPIFPTFPAFTGFSALGTPTFSAPLLSLNPIDTNLRTPYAEHYNFSVQQELPFKANLELGYLGSQGVKLLDSLQVNQATLANAANPIRGLTANASRNNNARVPVVGFSPTGLNEVTGHGHSNYNAFIATINKRSENFYVQAAYTFSKSIDNNSGNNAGGQDLGNSGGNQVDLGYQTRGISDFDRPHRLALSYRYNLPGFKTGVLRSVLGGWELGGLNTFQSGLPVSFACVSCTSSSLFGESSFPNIVGNLATLDKGGDPRQYVDAGGAAGAYDTTVLAVPPTLATGSTFQSNQFGGPGTQTFTVGGPGTGSRTGTVFGNLSRNPGPRGQFQQQWDAYVGKSFKLRESLGMEFRAEAFNVLNHPIFARPNGTVGSSQFGRITATVTDPRIIQFALKLKF